MLLHRERARVEVDAQELDPGDEACPEADDGESNQLSYHLYTNCQKRGFRGGNGGLTPVIVTEGKRKKKNWLRPGMMMAQIRPTSHARKVAQGMSGSSVLATADLTSGYGESSSAVGRVS